MLISGLPHYPLLGFIIVSKFLWLAPHIKFLVPDKGFSASSPHQPYHYWYFDTDYYLLWEAVMCLVGCLVTSRFLPINCHCDNQKRLQTLPAISWVAESPVVGNHCIRLEQLFSWLGPNWYVPSNCIYTRYPLR